MKTFIFIFCILYLSCSGNSNDRDPKSNYYLITDQEVQDTLFKKLDKITGSILLNPNKSDSLSFLILPVRTACPACRKKTIKDIVKYKDNLDNKHFIIITGEGLKSITDYFNELELELPYSNHIFYDTLEAAIKENLISTNPNIYHSFNKKVYEKVNCIPKTIKEDLNSFFNVQ